MVFFCLRAVGLVRRGVLCGSAYRPFCQPGLVCPIYGVGVVVVILLLTPVRENVFLLFACSVVLTSALEWLTGFVLEKLFHQKWWDYSDMPYNLNGYICPMFSVLWGIACLLVMEVIHPMVAGVVEKIPHLAGVVLLWIFAVLLAVDLAATVSAMVGLNRHLRQLDELAGKIRAASNELGENLSAGVLTISEKSADLKEDLSDRGAEFSERLNDLREDLSDRKAAWDQEQARRRQAREAALKRREAALAELKAANEELLSTYSFGQRRLLKAFPHMTSTRYAAALEELRARLERGRRRKL